MIAVSTCAPVTPRLSSAARRGAGSSEMVAPAACGDLLAPLRPCDRLDPGHTRAPPRLRLVMRRCAAHGRRPAARGCREHLHARGEAGERRSIASATRRPPLRRSRRRPKSARAAVGERHLQRRRNATARRPTRPSSAARLGARLGAHGRRSDRTVGDMRPRHLPRHDEAGGLQLQAGSSQLTAAPAPRRTRRGGRTRCGRRLDRALRLRRPLVQRREALAADVEIAERAENPPRPPAGPRPRPGICAPRRGAQRAVPRCDPVGRVELAAVDRRLEAATHSSR